VDFGGGDSAVGGTSAGWSLSVGALAVGVKAVMVVEGQHWRQCRCLRMFVAVVSVGKRQKSITSW
jgi:hypothetical protein